MEIRKRKISKIKFENFEKKKKKEKEKLMRNLFRINE